MHIIKYSLVMVLASFHFFVFGQHNVVPATNEFVIKGEVKNELKITIKDLLRYKQEALGDVVITNKQGEVKSVGKGMKGVLLKTILDSANIYTEKHKEYSELCIILIASDDYRNVYSWNEIYNTEVGQHIFIISEKDGKPIDTMEDRILVMSLADINSGSRHLKGLARIEVKKVR